MIYPRGGRWWWCTAGTCRSSTRQTRGRCARIPEWVPRPRTWSRACWRQRSGPWPGRSLPPPPRPEMGEASALIWLLPTVTDLDVFWMREVSRVEDGFIVGITTPEQHPASWLGSEDHGDHWPGVSVGQGSVHLPQRVTDPVSLEHESSVNVRCWKVSVTRHRCAA